MARVNIPVKTVLASSAAGIDLSVGGVAADATNHHKYFNPAGKTALVVITAAASGVSVTVISVADPYGRLGNLGPTAIGASKVHLFGPFPNLLFANQGVTDLDYTYIDLSGLSGTVTLIGVNI